MVHSSATSQNWCPARMALFIDGHTRKAPFPHSLTSCSRACLALRTNHLHIGTLYTAHGVKCHRWHLKAAKESQIPFVDSSEMEEADTREEQGTLRVSALSSPSLGHGAYEDDASTFVLKLNIACTHHADPNTREMVPNPCLQMQRIKFYLILSYSVNFSIWTSTIHFYS